jgi:hypothetical protein
MNVASTRRAAAGRLAAVTRAIAAFAAVALPVAVALASPPAREAAAQQPEGRLEAPPAREGGGPEYVLGAHEGFVAVFVPPYERPAAVTEIDIRALRARDAALIAEGIAIDSYDKLIQTLEDFDA